MKLALGCDQGGFNLREPVIEAAKSCGYEIVDCGIKELKSVDYPDIAKAVCEKIESKECEVGILMCGTGIGISIAANRHPGIRCALLSDCYSAQMAKKHNCANVMALGGRVMGADLAALITTTFLTTDFTYIERHEKRIEKLEHQTD